MDLGITGRTAVVTGAAGGIGRHTTRLLLEGGVQVVMVDQSKRDLADAVDWLPDHHGGVLQVPCDLGSDAAARQLADTVAALAGEVDILVHGAGTTGAAGAFHEVSDDDWVDAITINLLSAVRVTRAFLPALRHGGWGRIVFVDSEDGDQPHDDGLPSCAARAGLLSFAHGLARSYADEGLLINTVSSAFLATPRPDPMMEEHSEENDTSAEETIDSLLTEEHLPTEVGRRGRPDEIAAAVALLCSDRAAFVHVAGH